jgi:hypothetical protein
MNCVVGLRGSKIKALSCSSKIFLSIEMDNKEMKKIRRELGRERERE